MNKQKERDKLTLIRITEDTKKAIKCLAEEKGLKMVTILEYILKGLIDYKELTKYYEEK